jgi:hypothetical protein
VLTFRGCLLPITELPFCCTRLYSHSLDSVYASNWLPYIVAARTAQHRKHVSEYMSIGPLPNTRPGEDHIENTSSVVTHLQSCCLAVGRYVTIQPPARADSSLVDFSTLKMEAIRLSKTSVHTRSRSIRRHIPEDGILHSYRRENLKSYNISEIWPNGGQG